MSTGRIVTRGRLAGAGALVTIGRSGPGISYVATAAGNFPLPGTPQFDVGLYRYTDEVGTTERVLMGLGLSEWYSEVTIIGAGNVECYQTGRYKWDFPVCAFVAALNPIS